MCVHPSLLLAFVGGPARPDCISLLSFLLWGDDYSGSQGRGRGAGERFAAQTYGGGASGSLLLSVFGGRGWVNAGHSSSKRHDQIAH